MSQYQSVVCELILEESFGELVKEVGSYLLRNGGQKLKDLVKGLKKKKSDVIKSLIVLIQHSLVSCISHKSATIYRMMTSNILCRGMFPQYAVTGRELSGEIGEAIIEDFILNGHSCMSEVITRVVLKLSDTNQDIKELKLAEDVKNHFVNLVDMRLLQRVALAPSKELGMTTPSHSLSPQDKYVIPVELGASDIVAACSARKRGRASPDEGELPPSKKSKSDEQGKDPLPPDATVLWYIDFQQFQCHYRDQAIVAGVNNRIDPIAAGVMKCLLSLSTQDVDPNSYPIVGPEIFLLRLKDTLPQYLSLTDTDLEQYLTVLTEDGFIEKVGEASSGSYHINFKKCSEILCQSQLELVVRERFNDKHLRLFRLLCLKKRLEQKQISDMALIPNKKAKEILYSLLAENFITLQEVPRSNDYAPSRTFHLFSIELNTTTRIVLQRCYKALGNLMTCRKEEGSKNKRLLEKYKLWLRQQEAFQNEEEPIEIEEALTPTEREMTENVMKKIAKLEASELQLMESLLTFEEYLKFVS
ncbi:PREDICTED: DNA-directed RNA polymerase III subunit RPC3-like [Amphimedon queenslandica]|uniref:DNA-directed RNA polymerase III subunit RPC3 n=1 Tax=Amphimedon queenslandica TaxID=400682 RepID=A0A1X7V828_AMPQE|nr:PREDICTED: DNA-directed RNA polymerase III subunit RPC3-like [Amphimedon queenslandica]|eukprot:XP_003385389.1 PREDICTED: DNA-directed RNA polymerase III subunit RPC3-like [Amphimedon queenslandica]